MVLVGTGSKYEQKEVNGISHFLEHMFFKGTKKRPDKVEIAETLDRVGGAYNAFTGQEYTGYWAKVKAEHFDVAFDWAADIFLNSLLPDLEIQKERGVIAEEINMYYDNPASYVQELWQEVLYGNQPMGWPIAGTRESIGNVTRRRLVEYMQNQYVASNTIVCLAGNFKQGWAIRKAKEYFSDAQVGRFKTKSFVVEKQTQPELILRTRNIDQAHICLGARGYNIAHPARYALELLAVILGGMMSSRLFIEVREKLGIAYYIKTSAELDPDTGYLVSQAGIERQSVERAIKVILKEYVKISSRAISPRELKKAKDYVIGTSALALESSDAKASFYGMQDLLEHKILTPEEIYGKIKKVSAEDIRKVARDIFRPAKLNLAVLGPFENAREFKKILNV